MEALYYIYLRKSRGDGEETVADVLARHERILQEYAVRHTGSMIPEEHIFREVVSGETIRDRPMMLKLLSLIQEQLCTAVLVVEPQRLSRGDLQDCGTIIRAFRYTGTHIMTPQKTYNLEDKFDRKFFEMELMRGNDYLEYVKEIMLRGRIASASEGNFIGSVPPFGYDKVKIGRAYTLAENDEAEAVRLIYELYVNEGMGFAHICRRLEQFGFHPRKNAHWAPATVRSILQNPVYIGKIRWNRRKTVKHYEDGEIRKSRPNAPDESCILVDGKHPPLIPETLFYAAQKKFGSHPRNKRDTMLSNPFAGICKCECGAAMVLKPSEKAKPRMICQRQSHCHNKSAIYEEYEREVLRLLAENIPAFEARYKSRISGAAHMQEEILVRLKKELLGIEIQQNKLYDLLERGLYTESVFAQRNQALSQRRSNVQESIRCVEECREEGNDCPDRIVSFRQAVMRIHAEDIPASEKNRFLKTLIREIRYSRPVSRYDKTPFLLEISFLV